MGTIKRLASWNIRVIPATKAVVQSTHFKPYSCKCSKKTYTQNQLLILITFKDSLNQHCRELIEDIRDMELLNLSTIPHFTTLQKFLCRIYLCISEGRSKNGEPVLGQ
jgi:hypothetical protein